MKMRDYFAIQIMQAFVKNTAALPTDNEYSYANVLELGVNGYVDLTGAGPNNDEHYTWAQILAEEAYVVADAMVEARGARERDVLTGLKQNER